MTSSQPYPVDIVLAPSWWHRHAGISFDRDFYYHPVRRVETERRMERELHERWGAYGLGEHCREYRPEVGPVHLAAGYLVSAMMGCAVDYPEDSPPQVKPANMELKDIGRANPFMSRAFKDFLELTEKLKDRFGHLTGDVNWNGILNVALDLRGEALFMDFYDRPDEVRHAFSAIHSTLERFTDGVRSETGTTSVSVNRTVRHMERSVLLHSECSLTMVSTDAYEEFLIPYDIAMSRKSPFGIHYCGSDPHRFAESFSKIPRLDFLDVGWGGDVKALRARLPNVFLNIRLSPVELPGKTPEEIEADMRRLAADSDDPFLTGFCCINMDSNVGDGQVEAVLRTAESLRREISV